MVAMRRTLLRGRTLVIFILVCLVLFGVSVVIPDESWKHSPSSHVSAHPNDHVVTVSPLHEGQGGWDLLSDTMKRHQECKSTRRSAELLEMATKERTFTMRRHVLHSNDVDLDYGRVIVSTFSTEIASLVMNFLRSIDDFNKDVLVLLIAVDVNENDVRDLVLLHNRLLPGMAVELLALSSESLASLYQYRPGSPGILKHIPIATMARLLLPSIAQVLAPHTIDHVLYLDLDTSVHGDLTPLFAGQVCDPPLFVDEISPQVCGRQSADSAQLFSGWLSTEAKCALQTPPQQARFTSFNAGVVLMSMSHMQSWGFAAYAVAISSFYGMNDQVVLSLYAQAAGLSALNPAYNRWATSGEDTKFPASSNLIMHFNGSRKPWTTVWHPWGSYFFKYEPPGYLIVWSSLVAPFGPTQIEIVKKASQVAGVFPLHVVCSTKYCQDTVIGLALDNVRVRDIRLSRFFDGPFGYWFQQHPIVKIHTGELYPHQFQVAVELATLHYYGGVLLPWSTELDDLNFTSALLDQEDLWCMPLKGGGRVMGAPKNHDSIAAFSGPFVSQGNAYATGDVFPRALPANVMSGCDGLPRWEGASSSPALPLVTSSGETSSAIASWTAVKHFGLLWFDERARYLTSVGNMTIDLGDEVQAVAAAQWLPMINKHVERDNMDAAGVSSASDASPIKPIIMFMNAWYGTQTMTWPPPANVDPILLAVQVEPNAQTLFTSPASIAYLKERGPVGARDTITNDLFAQKGIDTFMSGCMTLTMQRPRIDRTAGCDILIVDVSQHIEASLPQSVRDRSCKASPEYYDGGSGDRFDGLKRFSLAHELLQKYASAKIVVTSRLQTALPSASMGVPVLLVLEEFMPGGGSGQRFAGLSQLVHLVFFDGVNSTKVFEDFNWDNPPPNPSPNGLRNFRCGFKNHLTMHGPSPAATVNFTDVMTVFDTSIFTTNCS